MAICRSIQLEQEVKAQRIIIFWSVGLLLVLAVALAFIVPRAILYQVEEYQGRYIIELQN